MRIRPASSTGRPEPQFVVEAETEAEKLMLKMFIDIKDESSKDLKIHLHGHTRGDGGVSSFNFGWIESNKVDSEDIPY